MFSKVCVLGGAVVKQSKTSHDSSTECSQGVHVNDHLQRALPCPSRHRLILKILGLRLTLGRLAYAKAKKTLRGAYAEICEWVWKVIPLVITVLRQCFLLLLLLSLRRVCCFSDTRKRKGRSRQATWGSFYCELRPWRPKNQPVQLALHLQRMHCGSTMACLWYHSGRALDSLWLD